MARIACAGLRRSGVVTVVSLVAFTFPVVAGAGAGAQGAPPGSEPGSGTGTSSPRQAVAAAPLAPMFSEIGRLSLSVDGLGTNDPAGGVVQVEKAPGATVRNAYLAATSRGFSGYTPVDADVTVDGSAVSWDAASTRSNSISSVNVLADVTGLVKAKVDAAPSGRVDFIVAEPSDSTNIEGEILAVVLDDPTVQTQKRIVLHYGAQGTSGDTFTFSLPEPIDASNPGLSVRMGLGVSYGAQPSTQFSEVDVNGQRLSTSAGGQDDGGNENGTLLTVGGLDDSPANPPDPFADGFQASCPRCDDELYDLLPFVNDGDTAVSVSTRNPSGDDNVFFAALTVETPGTRYRIDLKAWIPQPEVVDPEQPLALPFLAAALIRRPCFRPNIFLIPVTIVQTRYEGDDHDGFDGSYRVKSAIEFDWDGTQVSNVQIPEEPMFGTTRLNATYSNGFQTRTCEVAQGVADRASSATAAGSSFRLNYSAANPLVRGPAPAIDGLLDGTMSADGTITLRFDTDLFPSHGLRVTRNGVVQVTDIVSSASCLPDFAVVGLPGLVLIGAGLVAQINEGDRIVAPTDSGQSGSTRSRLCP